MIKSRNKKGQIKKRRNLILIENGEAKIFMNNTNESATIDEEDVEKVREYTWVKNNKGYIVCNIHPDSRKQKMMSLHRLVMSVHDKKYDRDRNQIDHISRNKLDNRKSNLRLCNDMINQANTDYRKRTQKSHSKIKNIHHDKTSRKPWRIKIKGKHICRCTTIEEAQEILKTIV